MRRPQFVDRLIEIGAALLKMAKLGKHHFFVQGEIVDRFGGAAVGIQQIGDFGKREAEMLAFENELKPRFLGRIVEARAAAADRLEESALLVKAEGPEGDAIDARDFADRQHFGERQIRLGGGIDALGGGFHFTKVPKSKRESKRDTRKGCNLGKHNLQSDLCNFDVCVSKSSRVNGLFTVKPES